MFPSLWLAIYQQPINSYPVRQSLLCVSLPSNIDLCTTRVESQYTSLFKLWVKNVVQRRWMVQWYTLSTSALLVNHPLSTVVVGCDWECSFYILQIHYYYLHYYFFQRLSSKYLVHQTIVYLKIVILFKSLIWMELQTLWNFIIQDFKLRMADINPDLTGTIQPWQCFSGKTSTSW